MLLCSVMLSRTALAILTKQSLVTVNVEGEKQAGISESLKAVTQEANKQARISENVKAVNRKKPIGKLKSAKTPKQSTEEANRQAGIRESITETNISSLSYR